MTYLINYERANQSPWSDVELSMSLSNISSHVGYYGRLRTKKFSKKFSKNIWRRSTIKYVVINAYAGQRQEFGVEECAQTPDDLHTSTPYSRTRDIALPVR